MAFGLNAALAYVMMLQAGRLRHWITIRRSTRVADGKGGYTAQWQTLARCKAELTGLDGREAVIGEAFQGIAHYRIILRWRSGIKTSDQVMLADGMTLNVRSASDPNGRRRALQILADTGSTERDVLP